LRDPHVGKALRLIHARPAEGWTLDRLAREAGLSRTVFAERFSDYEGVSPVHYLTGWRLQLASTARTDGIWRRARSGGSRLRIRGGLQSRI
jgi:transcriptional regulator GlxA family with amidase domain